MIAGAAIYSWLQFHREHCQPYILWERCQGGDARFEWFTWLAERIEEFDFQAATPQPAHLAYKDWKPPVA